MRIRIFSTPAAAASALATDLVRAISANPRLVLGLPAGQTPILLYRQLVERYREGVLDCSGLTTFNLDEFVGIGGDDPRSYRVFMRHHLLDHLNVPARRTHFLNGLVRDTRLECRRYEEAIQRAGGIDVQVLGLGRNGHIGFNEPADSLAPRSHPVALTAATRRANAPLFGGRPTAVPRKALTVGMATILHARRIVLLATGAAKARAVARAVNGPLTTRMPASFLQLHRDVEVWLDRAAAAGLNR